MLTEVTIKGYDNSGVSSPKFWGEKNIWFQANNSMLFGIPPL